MNLDQSDENNRHLPVLLKEVIDAFSPSFVNSKKPVCVDGTLGGAGHTRALLAHFPNLKILGCDYDLSAITAAKNTLSNEVENHRLDFFHGNFKDLSENAPYAPWTGVLLDLGYSSNQLENPEYGMSFILKTDAPLDMRLSRPPTGSSAWEILQEHTETELAEIFAAYGEFSGAYKVAQKIKTAISSGELQNSTRSLAGFMERILGRKKDQIHPATLVFQALRIAVNDELRNLDLFLKNVTINLETKGRIAIITFHSLEDRIVKKWGKDSEAQLIAVTKKPLLASDEEIKINPRARSAKLRVYEKK